MSAIGATGFDPWADIIEPVPCPWAHVTDKDD